MLQWIESVNQFLHPLLWGWPVLSAILLAGANLTIRSGFFQFTHCILWIKTTFCILFRHQKASKEGISPLQALTTALAGSIGTGNIVGVATALTIGGPGAIFWMWISALFGMMTIFAENVLGMKYRVKNEKGEWQGGAMYYIHRGIHCRPLALVFAGACVLASLGMGNMAQSNSIAGALQFAVAPKWVGLTVAILLLWVSFGGMRRTAKVTEKLVPFMAIGYLIACTVVLIANHAVLPHVFSQIFSEAFNLQSVAGGAGGSIMLRAMQCGISRGIFTNEAGLGTSVMAHTSSNGTEPVEQGMWGIFQIFIDTILMCTVTALCILSSGTLSSGKDGAELSAAAFASVFGPWGNWIVSICITLFAFATMLAWCCYGERSLTYLTGGKGVFCYRILFAAAAFFSCGMAVSYTHLDVYKRQGPTRAYIFPLRL